MGLITFSVVTPSFNQGEFIEETIKSVLSQKGKFCIEYIIMDGGSADNSVDIIKKYENLLKEGKWPVKCKGIEYKWLSERDEGQADAIEKGFAYAKGDIGVWLNSDDIFYSDNTLETVAMYFEKEDINLLIGNGIIIDKQGCKTGNHKTDRIDFKELVFLDYHILQPSAFLKIQFLKNNPFDKRLNYTFDADFFIRLILSGVKYKKVSDTFSCFRLYPETKTISSMYKRVKESMIIERKVTNSRLLLCASWIYKYFSVVIRVKYGKSYLVRFLYPYINKLFYRLIVGTWGRK